MGIAIEELTEIYFKITSWFDLIYKYGFLILSEESTNTKILQSVKPKKLRRKRTTRKKAQKAEKITKIETKSIQ